MRRYTLWLILSHCSHYRCFYIACSPMSEGLRRACRYGHTNASKYLIERGADINFRGFFGSTGLHWAAIDGYTKTVLFPIENHADLHLKDEEYTTTPIDCAKRDGHHGLVTLLRQHGAQE